ncbi:MAG: ABC-2 transporter permease [Oscillospiraceae bacterium]|nr:ABC-2 transporter permease [Oscillospiraceae bacterium]
MSGLIVKDFLILRKTLRTYLLMLVIYTGIAFSGFLTADIVGVIMVVTVAILPMNVFAYDKQCQWDTYGLALPVGRTKTVAARYLCVLLICLVSVAMVSLLGVALWAAGRIEETVTFIASCSVMGLLAILMNAAMLPFLYKFGPERARMMFYGVLGLLVLAGAVFLFPLGGLEWLKSLEIAEPPFAQAVILPAAAALAGLALLAVSFLLSRHFYGTKDV